jgi:UDP-3-O-[3-hydroxymyristoyl] N-acetylglucosamine deacetylase
MKAKENPLIQTNEKATCPISLEPPTRVSKTIAKSVCYSGIGIHTGQEVTITLKPAKSGKGVFFRRVDLPSCPIIPATFEYVFDTSRSTNIGIQDVKIYTIEHILAALKAYEIDNIEIELNNIEPPAGNGSSDIFCDLIEEAGVKEQGPLLPILKLDQPVYYSEKDIHLVALPANSFQLSYTLHYPQSPALGTQYFSMELSQENFRRELASCRTFALFDELSFLIDKGLIKGGSLDNAVVVKGKAVISKGGLFFPNEMARHKMLDLIGDLSLIGFPFSAHVIAIRSGHASNFQFAKKLFQHLLETNKNGSI